MLIIDHDLGDPTLGLGERRRPTCLLNLGESEGLATGHQIDVD